MSLSQSDSSVVHDLFRLSEYAYIRLRVVDMARHSKKKARVIAMHPNQGRIVEAILFIVA